MREFIVRAFALVVPVALVGCSVFGDDRPGVAKVEDFVARVERVHVEVELARESAASSVRALQGIAAPDFTGDKVESFRALTQSGEDAQTRASALRESVTSMRLAAEPVFERWRLQLDGIASASVRSRSEQRMRAARERYEIVAQSAVPAVEDFDALNRAIRDLTLFLDHDFNRAAIGTIRDDLVSLGRNAADLDMRFERCLGAAQAYLAAVGPAGTEDPSAQPVR